MKIAEKIKSLFRRQPLTEEELAARAEAERERAEARVAALPGRGGFVGAPVCRRPSPYGA
jgi:hypothetical protein